MSKKRRQFTDEFKANVVEMYLSGDRSIAQVARDLDLAESALHRWIQRAKAQASPPRLPEAPLTRTEQEELARLRKENARLKKLLADRDLEIDCLKEVASKNW